MNTYDFKNEKMASFTTKRERIESKRSKTMKKTVLTTYNKNFKIFWSPIKKSFNKKNKYIVQKETNTGLVANDLWQVVTMTTCGVYYATLQRFVLQGKTLNLLPGPQKCFQLSETVDKTGDLFSKFKKNVMTSSHRTRGLYIVGVRLTWK